MEHIKQKKQETTNMIVEYRREREGLNYIERDFGFAFYYVDGSDLYIADFYIRPEFRKNHIGSEFLNEIAAMAKDFRCTRITAKNYPMGLTSKEALIACLETGFKIQNEIIYLTKEL